MDRTTQREKLHELLIDCSSLDVHATIYHLLQSHGWLEELTLFAETRPDYTTVILHYASRRDFAGAIQKFIEFPAIGECEDLVIRFAPVLFGAEPQAFAQLLLRQQFNGISPLSVLPAVAASPLSSDTHRREAVSYLEFAVRTHPEITCLAGTVDGAEALFLRGRGGAGSLLLDGDLMSGVDEDGAGGIFGSGRGPWSSGTAVLSALVVLYARECALQQDAEGRAKAEEVLLKFFASQEGNSLLDLHFALRVCRERGLARAAVQLCGYMGLHEEAVDAALENGEITLAKHNASKPADRRQRLKLWLRIVENQASGSEPSAIVQTIASLIRESQELSVRDVLPHMNDMITIDAFQTEICECLDMYKDQVLQLRQEMDDHRRALQAFKEDLKAAEDRCIVVNEDQACEICGEASVRERFYAFACTHCFHEACLRALVVPALETERRQRLFDLESKRIEHQAAGALGDGAVGPSAKELEEVEDELDGILADDCPLCGKLMIQAIRRPFIDPDEVAEAESWAID